ncbi:MAG: two-component response regulator [Actinomycetia bacterium]|nr:two-component response regulator [Actinomycetes bacterium]
MVARLRTLLVDDVEDIRALLRILMEQDGRFDVVAEAADGEEAIALAAEHQPDVVVLDLAMPVMDGLTALPALREAVPQVKVVILSGFPVDEMGPAAREAGAIGYLEKGRNVAALAADIHDLAGVLGAVEAVLERELPAEPRSAGQARQALTSALIAEVPDAALDTLVLLTSELVTNVVAHARTTCHLGVELFADVVRVSVSDEDERPIAPRVATDEAESGRGLALVEMLSSNWGVITRTRGKTVWFEVPRGA